MRYAEVCRPAGVPFVARGPWWVAERGHEVCTDRRKMQRMLMDDFATYLEPQFLQDLHTLRAHLCAGICIDETFKAASTCRVAVPADHHVRYEQAPFALHTVHSSVVNLFAGMRFLA